MKILTAIIAMLIFVLSFTAEAMSEFKYSSRANVNCEEFFKEYENMENGG